MKGIEDAAFQMLLSKNPWTIVEVTELCQSYDELWVQWLFSRRPVHDTFFTSLAAVTKNHLLGKVREFICAEVACQLSLQAAVPRPTPSLAPTFRRLLQDQVIKAIMCGLLAQCHQRLHL